MPKFRITTLFALAALALLAPPANATLPQLGGAVDLTTVTPNFSADGGATSDGAGQVVADAGDVNGDGIEDVLVGAPFADPYGRRDAGSLYVVFGRGDGQQINLGNLGSGGFRIDGAVAGDHLGWSAASAADVNGDGRSDIVVGARDARNNGRSGSGSAYVIFGRSSSAAVDTASLGSSGFRIDGAGASDRLGTVVAGGFDLNGDGHPDVAVAAPQADRNGRLNSGTAYVVWGKSSGTAVDTAALGSQGFAIDGAAAADGLGAVALTHDVTGDGTPDVLVGARAADPAALVDAGAAYVVAGRSGSIPVDLSQPGAAFYQANGAAAGDNAGAAVGEAGDLNGDGRPELVVGAPGADPNGRLNAGSLYLLLAPSAGGAHSVGALDSTWRIDGAAAGDAVGTSFGGGADLNADGRDDLAVGAQLHDAAGRVDSGETRVLYGGAFSGVVDLAAPPPGFRVDGAGGGDLAGVSVAIVPDATGDGHPDLIVGADRADRNGRGDNGAAYFLYGWGSARLSYPPTAATTVGQPLPALGPEAVTRTGPVSYSISPALPAGLSLDPGTGVISGSPTDVLDAGAAFTLSMTDLSGSVSVPFNLRVAPRPGPCANPHDGTKAADRIVGTSGGDKVNGGAGSDNVTGLGGDDCLNGEDDGDLLFGGDGNDQLNGGIGQDLLDGGSGDDQLFGDAGQDTMTGDGGNDVMHGGAGFDQMSGGDGNDELYGEQDTDSLDGGAGNDYLNGGDKSDKLVGGAGNDTIVGGTGNDIIVDRSGSNRIDAGPGNDKIDVRNGKRDVVNCGSGHVDEVKADRIDKLVGCERVKRSGAKPRKHGKRRRHG